MENIPGGSIAPGPRPLSVWTTTKLGFFFINSIVRCWCGRRLWRMGRNWNLGSKALRNVRRPHLSARKMSQSHSFQFELMYVFGLARGIRSLLPANTLRMRRSLSNRSIILSMLSVGRRGVGQKFIPRLSSDCSDFGATLPIVRSWKVRLVG